MGIAYATFSYNTTLCKDIQKSVAFYVFLPEAKYQVMVDVFPFGNGPLALALTALDSAPASSSHVTYNV